MNVSAVSITSTAMQGLNKAQATLGVAAQTIASGDAQTPASSQIVPGASAGLTGALVALTLAKVSFEANAETIKIGDAMVKTLLDAI